MKLRQLLLDAFGPFTDARIDFAAAAADLHLVYGRNEAGKSSALRAMRDLRFGIPERSSDDFLHPYRNMQIGGVFEDADGAIITVCRRKGRGQTLSRPEGEGKVTPELLLALTGGLGEKEFDMLFGIDHGRLREGGKDLLAGQGELGSALFEASAGSAGIARILERLESDAKGYYNPRSKASINLALNDYVEQRRQINQLQTRPQEWKRLKREHDETGEDLQSQEDDLKALRRTAHELTELRTVEPLLRALDAGERQLAEMQDIPELAADAADRRKRAEDVLQRAGKAAAMARADLDTCTQAQQGLSVETSLLEHAEFIERLAMGHDSVQQARIELGRLAATAEGLEKDIAQASARITVWKSRDDLLHALPSEADRVSLESHLAELARLEERVQSLRELQARRTPETSEGDSSPDPELRRRLNEALAQAQTQGRLDARVAELHRVLQERQAYLVQSLSDLGMRSAQALRKVRPLLDGEIDAEQERRTEADRICRDLTKEDERLNRDLQEQIRRQQTLLARGEAVSVASLQQARADRQALWQRLREDWSASEDELIAEYEAGVHEADRQADLLRTDAERAATLEDCRLRIHDMQGRREAIARQLQAQAGQSRQALVDWEAELTARGLPRLAPLALREWQVKREHTLTVAMDSDSQAQGWQTARQSLQTHCEALGGALVGLGIAVQEGAELGTLVATADRWEKAAARQEAKQQERAKNLADRERERGENQARLERSEQEYRQQRQSLGRWRERLWLAEDSGPPAFKARLAELQHIEQLGKRLAEIGQQKARQQALVGEFNGQCRALAEILGESAQAHPEDLMDRLYRRLRIARERQQRRDELRREQEKLQHSLAEASEEQKRQEQILEGLRIAAGVEKLSDLPEIERLAEQKRRLHEHWSATRQQLAEASSKTIGELRETLAGRNVLAIETEQKECNTRIDEAELRLKAAREREQGALRALQAVDTSDAAAAAREAAEAAAARIRAQFRPWARLRLAHALLQEALKRYRERSQAPMIATASGYFARMTAGRYPRLLAEDTDTKPRLAAERDDGRIIGVEAMSEGTADQLYLALRLAALELRRASHPALPLILDDVLITSDEQRAANILAALCDFARGQQVMLFTHHHHLLELAASTLEPDSYGEHRLS